MSKIRRETKTAPLSDESHKYLKRLQTILYDKYDVDIQIKDIITLILRDENIADAESFAKKIVDKGMSNNIPIVNMSEMVESRVHNAIQRKIEVINDS